MRRVAVLVAVLGFTVSGFAKTIVVDLNGGADYTEIQPALDAAEDGDEVLVKAGEYVITEPIDFNRLHDPEDPESPPVKNLTLQSEAGAEVTIIRMSDTPLDLDRASVVVFENGETEDSVLEAFTITSENLGRGVYCYESSPALVNCMITSNYDRGVYCSHGSSPTLTDCTISGNGWNWGGGVYCYESSPTLKNCTISGNGARQGFGGGVCCGGASSPTLTDCTISGNRSGWGGGVYSGRDCSPILTGCTISENSATGDYGDTGCGGGVDCKNSSPTLTNCTISGNYSRWGGGVSCDESSPTMTDCSISGNSADWAGGGMSCDNSSFPTVTNCSISGNWAGEWMMGYNGAGGGVYCRKSSPSLINCTVLRNWAFSGGGVSCVWDPSPTMTNCTISGNSAKIGGGVSCSSSSPALTNCTISENWGVYNGGMYGDESSPTLTNCIVRGNTPESICGILSHCLTEQDPLFVRPGKWVDCESPDDPRCSEYKWDFGEPIAWHRWIPGDYHLQPGSPCIDAGSSEGAPTADIEGHARPCWNDIDIGAHEYCGEILPVRIPQFRRGDSNADGTTDISDGIFILSFLFLGGAEPPCLDAADTDDSGTLNVTDAVQVFNYLFLGGVAPPSPFPYCGIDDTTDDLTCVSFAACDAEP